VVKVLLKWGCGPDFLCAVTDFLKGKSVSQSCKLPVPFQVESGYFAFVGEQK